MESGIPQNPTLQIRINSAVYLKDPESSKLGKKIVDVGTQLIDEVGFEHFTFKKLAEKINSTEASIYRYFENKHKFLIYLISWYWTWQEYQLILNTQNIADPKDRLRVAMKVIALPNLDEISLSTLNKEALHRIVIAESPKTYLIKEVDDDNKHGFYWPYKRLCSKISEIIQEINPAYLYPTAFVSTIIESAHHQLYFSKHLPRLTEIQQSDSQDLLNFLIDLAMRVTI